MPDCTRLLCRAGAGCSSGAPAACCSCRSCWPLSPPSSGFEWASQLQVAVRSWIRLLPSRSSTTQQDLVLIRPLRPPPRIATLAQCNTAILQSARCSSGLLTALAGHSQSPNSRSAQDLRERSVRRTGDQQVKHAVSWGVRGSAAMLTTHARSHGCRGAPCLTDWVHAWKSWVLLRGRYKRLNLQAKHSNQAPPAARPGRVCTTHPCLFSATAGSCERALLCYAGCAGAGGGAWSWRHATCEFCLTGRSGAGLHSMRPQPPARAQPRR
jgi:hypothetical protein